MINITPKKKALLALVLGLVSASSAFAHSGSAIAKDNGIYHTYYIRSRGNDAKNGRALCLTVQSNPHVNLILSDCNGSDTQKWFGFSDGTSDYYGSYLYRNAGPGGRPLVLAAQALTPGSYMRIKAIDPNDNTQHWRYDAGFTQKWMRSEDNDRLVMEPHTWRTAGSRVDVQQAIPEGVLSQAWSVPPAP